MPNVHFEFGGSTAGRTLQCAGWQALAKTLPQQPVGANPDADKGTALHTCMEMLLADPDLPMQAVVGVSYNGQTVTDDDIDTMVLPAMEAYMDLCEQHGIIGERIEQEVRLNDQIGGTCDVLAFSEDTVFIVDWKFGYGEVSADANPQALFYAMCGLTDDRTANLFSTRKKVVLVIIQPRAEEILKQCAVDVDKVKAFKQVYLQAVKNRADEYTTGPYCKFCPAAAVCPAKTGQARNALMLDPESATAKELPEMLRMADELEDWIRQVRKLAHEQAELGTKIEGFKLVNKRASRKWSDEAAVLDIVRKARKIKLEDATDISLKSPAQLEKVCKKLGVDFEIYNAYIVSVSSGTTLVSDDDPRPAAPSVAAFAAAIQAAE